MNLKSITTIVRPKQPRQSVSSSTATGHHTADKADIEEVDFKSQTLNPKP